MKNKEKSKYPKLMWVWDDFYENRTQMEVHGMLGDKYLTGGPNFYTAWKNGKDIGCFLNLDKIIEATEDFSKLLRANRDLLND